MKLQGLEVHNLRSISSARLNDCGNFNVLIGKNNSGKSTLLTALNAFYECIGTGDIATLNPPLGAEIDYHNKRTESPIRIQVEYGLTDDDWAALLADLSAETPQLKMAIEALPRLGRLAVTISILAAPARFAYVSRIALIHPEGDRTLPKVLLDIPPAAGVDLRDKFHGARRARTASEGLRAMLRDLDEETYRRIKSDSEPGRPPFRYLFRARGIADLDNDTIKSLENVFRESKSWSDFNREVLALASRTVEEAVTLEKEPLKHRVAVFSGEQAAIPTSCMNLIRRVGNQKILYLTDRRKPLGREEAQRLLQLKVKRGGIESLKRIQETVSNLLGVKVDAFESDRGIGQDRELRAEMDIDNFLAEVNGSGVREALRLILDYEFERPSLILVEEPEIHLHPALESSIMRYLKGISSECQVVLTTHSTNFLDTGEMRNVYLVSKARNTEVKNLNLEEAETHLPRELGIRLSALFMYENIVVVEGPSDEAVLREIAATLNINLSQPNVGFISMGGVNNFKHFAADSLLTFLSKRQVHLWFVVDHDERDADDIARMQRSLGEKATIHVLARRELENYLLSPRAIARLIAMKTGKAAPSEAAIEKQLDAAAESLKSLTISKHALRRAFSPIYPRIDWEKVNGAPEDALRAEMQRVAKATHALAEKAEAELEKQADHIGRSWAVRKLELVPGDLLLDGVFQNHGIRFRKERDSARLAALLHVEEILPELRKLLATVATTNSKL